MPNGCIEADLAMADGSKDTEDLLAWVRAHPDYTVTFQAGLRGMWVDVRKPEAGLEHSIRRKQGCEIPLLEQLDGALVEMEGGGESQAEAGVAPTQPPAETQSEQAPGPAKAAEDALPPTAKPGDLWASTKEAAPASKEDTSPRTAHRAKRRRKGFEADFPAPAPTQREKPLPEKESALPAEPVEAAAEPAAPKNSDDPWASDQPVGRDESALSTADEDVDTSTFPGEVLRLLHKIEDREKDSAPLPTAQKGWDLSHRLAATPKEKKPGKPAKPASD